jgi:serine/threonine protein phosphatase 1
MKIFALSDMHSFLTPTIKALKESGWDENNPKHIIVVCGDALDRGNETVEMVEWLVDLINKCKLIYITGNHDLLMQEMLNRGYSMSHDRHNGTEKSYYQLLNAHADKMDGRRPDEIVRTALQPLYDKMVNYFETKKYIFVHSWIPLNPKGFNTYTYREDWRNATDEEFELATWGNPFEMAKQGLNQTGKVLIFGHFHTSYQWSKDGKCSEFGDDAIFDPYFGKDFIGIYGCTAHTGEVNVLVLEDEFLE